MAAAARPALPPRGMCVGRKTTGVRKSNEAEDRSPRAKRSDVWGGNEFFRPSNTRIRPEEAETGLLGVARLSGVVGRCCNVPQNVGWIANLVPQPRGPIQRDPAPSRLRGGRRETKKVIAREDGYSYIAALRSPDLRHTRNEKETPLLLR